MKTNQIIFLSLTASFVLLTACTKDEPDYAPQSNVQSSGNAFTKSTIPGLLEFNGWRDDFNSIASLHSKWLLFGNPLWVQSAFGRTGMYDNNGTLPAGSRAVSKTKIGKGSGYTIESDVYIELTNTQGTTISPEIGVSQILNQPAMGISMKLVYIGNGVTSVPMAHRDHTYFQSSVLLLDGTTVSNDDYSLRVDQARDGWHKMEIRVSNNQHVSFYLDGQFIWSPNRHVHPSLLTDKNLVIGYTSSGSAGKTYHDWIKISYPHSPDQPTYLNNQHLEY